jgi:hypothetical protein
MPAIFLIIGLVFLPLIIGTCFAIAGFNAYRTRRLLVTDVERAHQPIELRDLEPRTHKSLQYLENNIALPILRSRADIKGIGGGFVQYFRPSCKPARKASVKSHTKPSKPDPGFGNTDLYAGPDWPGEDSIHQSQPVPAPSRIYTSTNYGRYNAPEVGESSLTAMYRHDGRVAEAWKKIGRTEPLVGGMRSGEVKGMPVVLEDAFGIGEGSDEEEGRGSFDSGRRHFEGKGDGVARVEEGVEGKEIVEGKRTEAETVEKLDENEVVEDSDETFPDHLDIEAIDQASSHSPSRRSSWSTDDSENSTPPTTETMP